MGIDVLITGAGGMVGSPVLARQGRSVAGTCCKPTNALPANAQGFGLLEMDNRYSQDGAATIARLRPQAVFDLAAQSYPTVSREWPQETMGTKCWARSTSARRSARSAPETAPRIRWWSQPVLRRNTGPACSPRTDL